MKHTKALLVSALCLWILIAFTGCGARIESKININPDGSGSRTIICKIPQSEVDRLRGGEKTLDEIISKNKPASMNYNKTIEENNRVYRFTYNFSDFNDYIAKTQQITGKKPETSLKISGNSLNRNYNFVEKNQNLDIMRWAIDEIERQKTISIALGEPYEIGETEVNLVGYKQYFQGDINISADKQFKMELANIETNIKSLGDISRSIQYVFSEGTDRALNINGELERYIQALVPKGGRYQRVKKDTGIFYEIGYSAGDINDLNIKTRKVTMDEFAELKISEVGEKNYSYVASGLLDSIDFMKFTGGSTINDGIKYRLIIPLNFSIRKVLDYNPSATGDKPQGFQMKNETNQRVIDYPIGGNNLKFTMEYTTPRSDSYFSIWIAGILLLGAGGVLFVRYTIRARASRETRRAAKEDTLSFDKEWKVELDNRLKNKEVE